MRIPITRVALLLIVAVVALLIPMPDLGRAGIALADLLHAPCFAILAVLVYRLLRPHVRMRRKSLLAVCWLTLVAFSGGTELAQHWSGRSPSYGDILANVAGVTAGLLIASANGRRSHWAVAGVLIGLAVIQPALTLIDVAIARGKFPLIASFEQPLELRGWTSQQSEISRARRHATDGNWSLKVDLSPAKYPGVLIQMTERDWSAHDTLLLDIYWEPPVDRPQHSTSHAETLEVIVKVEDKIHDGEYFDRFHHTAALEPGPNTIRIHLADIAAAPRDRAMDMTQINILQMFTIDPQETTTVYVDNVRLE